MSDLQGDQLEGLLPVQGEPPVYSDKILKGRGP